MKYLEILKLLLSLGPSLIAFVRALEEALPAGGQGAAKLAAVRGFAESAFASAQDVTGSFEQAWPALQSAVDVLVSFFNTAGVFKKG